MEKKIVNYTTMLKILNAISHSKDPEEVALMTVDSIKTVLDVKGCSLFLFNRKTNELELATSFGLSDEYLNKGPVSALRSIAQSLKDGPVAIYDVMDDPRIQYPKEAEKEGIKIFTIGVGQEGGAPIPAKDGSGGFKKDRRGDMIITHLDEVPLQKIALETGGTYVRSVTGDMDLDKIYQEGIKQRVEEKQLKSARKRRWEQRFQWFILCALLFLAAEFFVKET